METQTSLATFKIQIRATRKGCFIQIIESLSQGQSFSICIPGGHCNLVGSFLSVLLLVTLVLSDLYHRLERSENLFPHPLLHFDFQPLSSTTTNQYYPPSGQTCPKETLHLFRSTVELRQTEVLDHQSIWHSKVACDWTKTRILNEWP